MGRACLAVFLGQLKGRIIHLQRDLGLIVAPLDGDFDRAAARAPELENLRQAVPHAQGLHRTQVVIQGIGVFAGFFVDGDNAILSRDGQGEISAPVIETEGHRSDIAQVVMRGC